MKRGKCPCEGRRGKAEEFQYVRLKDGERQFWSWCSHCDSTESWPIFNRTSPHLPKE